MGSYEESSDALLIALTRLRRAERRSTPKPCLRAAATGKTAEFRPVVSESLGGSPSRSKARMQTWRRTQWKVGVRSCFYCRCAMTRIPKFGNPGPTSVTVDHVVPLSAGGEDAASNYAMCCSQCNNRKGSLSESEFRAVLAYEIAMCKS